MTKGANQGCSQKLSRAVTKGSNQGCSQGNEVGHKPDVLNEESYVDDINRAFRVCFLRW